MISLETLRLSLRQKPNSRERVIFFLAIIVLSFVFVKSCALKSHSAYSSMKEQLDRALVEKAALLKPAPQANIVNDSKKDDAQSRAARLSWIGNKESANFASDSLVQSAQVNGILLVKFSLPEYKEKKNFLYKPVSLTLAGSLTDIGRYLEKSEQLAIPLVIENIAIETNHDFSDLVTLRIEGGFYATKS